MSDALNEKSGRGKIDFGKKNSNVCCTEKTILQNIKNCTTYCYISHLVRALRLVSLAGRNSLYGPLNSNVCMTWKLSPLVEARDKVTILLILFFSIHTVNYWSSFFPTRSTPHSKDLVSRPGMGTNYLSVCDVFLIFKEN